MTDIILAVIAAVLAATIAVAKLLLLQVEFNILCDSAGVALLYDWMQNNNSKKIKQKLINFVLSLN